MIYEVSLYEVRKYSVCLISHSYWKRDKPYKGKTRLVKDYKNGKIIKYIDLISK